MSNRRRRAALTATALRRRRLLERIEVPAARDPTRTISVARAVAEVSDHFKLGAPYGHEYPVTGWQSRVGDRAQDFEGGTIHLDTATGRACYAVWQRP